MFLCHSHNTGGTDIDMIYKHIILLTSGTVYKHKIILLYNTKLITI